MTVKLWIDDVRPPPDDSWVWSKSSEHALAVFRVSEVSHVAFDFDLGETDTAERVAVLLEDMARTSPSFPSWSIHSANPVGAARLKMILERAERVWKERVKPHG